MTEIVRRLQANRTKNLKYLKESLPIKGLREKDDEEEEELLPAEDEELEDLTPPEEEIPADEEISPEDETPVEEETPEEPELKPAAPKKTSGENINPLDNSYAVNYKLGQRVSLMYTNGNDTKLHGTIEGYDKEGFYRVKWDNGLLTNGMTDITIAELIEDTQESKCICGSAEFVNEGKSLVCDKCGRRIRESKKGLDQLAIADKARPKGKRLIRSEAHPISTAHPSGAGLSEDTEEQNKKSIDSVLRNAFSKKKTMKDSYNFDDEYGNGWLSDREDDDEDQDYAAPNVPDVIYKLYNKLNGEFWTRLPELVEDVEEQGFEVVDSNSEYIVVSPENSDTEVQIYLGGTSRTMTLDFDKSRVL